MAGENNTNETTSQSGGVVLRVTPEELNNKEAELKNVIKSLVEEYKYIENLASSYGSVWEGEAYGVNRGQLSGFLDDLGAIISALADRPEQLEQIAGIYQGAENSNEGLATDLDSNVIS